MTTQEKRIQPGEMARPFTLHDQMDKPFDLAAAKGKNILLSCHPLAWTSVCALQMKSLEENFDALHSTNTRAVGLSVDSIPCKKAWAESLAITKTSLICDFWPHGGVAQLYGLFREAQGFSERANVIIDKTGKVVWVKVYPLPQLPDMKEVLGVLGKL